MARTKPVPGTHAAAEHRRTLIVGGVAVVVIALITVVAFTANRGHLPGAPTTTVRVAFTDVGQTDANSEVRTGGQRIGQVESVAVENGQAVATLVLDGHVDVHADAHAEIRDQSALAQKYVEFSPGSAAAPPLQGVLPAAHTDPTHDLADLLDVFDEPTRGALRSTLREVGGGLAGQGAALGRFLGAARGDLDDVGTITGALADPDADLPGMLNSGASLAGHLAPTSDELRSLLAQSRDTLAAVSTDGGRPLAQTVAEAADTLPALRTASDSFYGPLGDTGNAMRTLGPGAAALGRATPDLHGVLREAVPPLDEVPGVADHAKPALTDLTRTFADLRPFVPRLDDGLRAAAPPLAVLSRHTCDITLFTDTFSRLNTSHNGFRHQFRIFLSAPSSSSLSGLPAGFGDAPLDTYPAPCTAFRDRDPNGALVPGGSTG
ncbi:MlaD family protein [Actinomycetospora sp. TBRC 11914]|uniref:MlaD family protein n=1 Tax=Actinomycetospora sp. TBRC 11914 TaxID=2729387 RepID=UPI00145DF37D|nr:MlaD family protein [Actinomycetospora sp. TBRC 11914]NMO91479.1 MCE family protein [Actinomycetospora sp. TBRC 11914]